MRNSFLAIAVKEMGIESIGKVRQAKRHRASNSCPHAKLQMLKVRICLPESHRVAPDEATAPIIPHYAITASIYGVYTHAAITPTTKNLSPGLLQRINPKHATMEELTYAKKRDAPKTHTSSASGLRTVRTLEGYPYPPLFSCACFRRDPADHCAAS